VVMCSVHIKADRRRGGRYSRDGYVRVFVRGGRERGLERDLDEGLVRLDMSCCRLVLLGLVVLCRVELVAVWLGGSEPSCDEHA